MSVETCKAIGRRFFEEQDRLRGGPADELCAREYTAKIGSNPPMPLAGHKQFSQMFYGGFPDVRHTITDVVADEDCVAVHFVLDGTHTGNFMAIPPTGRTIHVNAMAIMNIAGDRVTDLRGVFDQAGMMRQLGLAGV